MYFKCNRARTLLPDNEVADVFVDLAKKVFMIAEFCGKRINYAVKQAQMIILDNVSISYYAGD